MGAFSRLAGKLFNPAQRLMRKARAYVEQGYEGARYGRRLAGWRADLRTINALLLSGGDTLRARSRQLCRENADTFSAQACFSAAAVGCGITFSSLVEDQKQKEEIQTLLARWIAEADFDGVSNFYGQQELAAAAVFEAGEIFIRFRPRPLKEGLSVPLQLQLLESEMLPFWKNEPCGNGGIIREGIEFDKDGRRAAYHFYTAHPGELYPVLFNAQTVRVPASEIIHVFKVKRPGQLRGQPMTVPSMVKAYLFDIYDDAEVDRKKTAAMFAGFVTKNTAEDDTPVQVVQSPPGEVDVPLGAGLAPMEPGTIQVLLEGEDIKFSNPTEVGGSYEAFVWRQKLSMAAGYGVPYAGMSGDSSKSNYSSMRNDRIEFKARVEPFQSNVLVFQMCRAVIARWFDVAVLAGKLSIPVRDYAKAPEDYRRGTWIPPKWDWVDPWKDLKAEELALNLGTKARSQVTEEQGFDAIQTDKRILADQQREEALNLKFRPVEERLNVNIAAESPDASDAVSAADERGTGAQTSAGQTPAAQTTARGDPAFEAHLRELEDIEQRTSRAS